MEISGSSGKTPSASASLSFRYNANNEELEELFDINEDDPPTPQMDASPSAQSENTSPKRGERTPSIIDKYFKSIRPEKNDDKTVESKSIDEKGTPPKEVSSSPMKDYLNRFGKRSQSETSDAKEVSSETWRIFHDFKFKIAQAVEDMKSRSLEETKEKHVPRDNSTDSEDNSAIKDSDQSVGDTENQVSSLESSMQNLSEMTQPVTAKAAEKDPTSLPVETKHVESSDVPHKNVVFNVTTDLTKHIFNDATPVEVESGIEAMEDGIEGFCEAPQTTECAFNKPLEDYCTQNVSPLSSETISLDIPLGKQVELPIKHKIFDYTLYLLSVFLFTSFILFPAWSVWNGFLLGIWFFYLMGNCKQWVLDNYFGEEPMSTFLQVKRSSAMPLTYTIPSVKEHRPIKKFEGWINHYRYPEYDPYTYHISKTTSAFMKLEGCNLRISYTKTKIRKRAIWNEKINKVEFYQHRLYNLTGARVILLPKGLVRRRNWSKKYPICIILSETEKIQVLERETVAAEKKTESGSEKKKHLESQHEVEVETNTSPEKKRKFIWRRKEKNSTHSEGEVGKEGLRHRLVRKIHRDKKTDNVSTSTEPLEGHNICAMDEFHDAEVDPRKSLTSTKDDDEDIDDTELSRIKEFLEEAELETGAEGPLEGEWSIHVKRSRDKHAYLYFFARSGREKHEWFRRISTAIEESQVSSESSTAEERVGTESVPDNKEAIEMTVYKLSEKDTVAFARGGKLADSMTESSVTFNAPAKPISTSYNSYDKNFWPYLIKIIQPKRPLAPCDCRMLPAEMTWLNTLLARVTYDVMRNDVLIARLQTRVQKKLHTLKLPSFMSPLMVTELSLTGACPLVERISAPAWDERGVWLDADIRYEGGAYITILTQINLMKLKEKNLTLEEHILDDPGLDETDDLVSGVMSERQLLKRRKPAIFDSEMEDSAESSDDNEDITVQPVDSDHAESEYSIASGGVGSVMERDPPASSKKKFIRMVDKIAANKYFQQVTDYKYVKRAMEGLSNTDIKLQLQVQALEGRMAINLPPPPHDRVWLGFRPNPQLILKARPAVGARSLRFAHISNWIEQKLTKEFEKVLVLPNMEDIIIDVMTPTPIDFE